MSWAIPATVVSMTFLQRADGGRETVSFRAGGRAQVGCRPECARDSLATGC